MPSIRKTGGYGRTNVAALVKDPATMLRLLHEHAQQNVLPQANNTALGDAVALAGRVLLALPEHSCPAFVSIF
jgi:hypothetical protein